ncbi:MAG: hypothetical protein DWQ45_24905 [Planctomycetota bacterium]|nr:MAG: hypothetical protein DWQ41_09535 [Planctomycetota bacterium]REK28304.1 MAG: hypothetical protein DWQ45_24905 [Planctomycetota bacterium]
MWDSIRPYTPWILTLSAMTFVGTLVAIPILLVRMPADYFIRRRVGLPALDGLHPVLRWTVRVLKNLLGVFLVLAGLAMSVPAVPGQGLLTILIGITLLDLPGKRKMELAIVRRKRVLRAINWIRAKAGRAALEIPDRKRIEA